MADSYIRQLEEIIHHCQQQEPAYTPSDYGLAGKLHYKELSAFLAQPQEGRPRKALISRLYGLSPLQEGLLFHGLYDQSTASYMEQLSCQFTGLQVAAFKASWQQLLSRHSILRTSFHYQDLSLPVQCVHHHVELPFVELDFRPLSPAAQQQQLKAFKEADKQKGFDFSQAPLLRLSLIRLSEQVYSFVWTHHHLLLDGWSLPILLQELLSTYEGLLKGGKPTL